MTGVSSLSLFRRVLDWSRHTVMNGTGSVRGAAESSAHYQQQPHALASFPSSSVAPDVEQDDSAAAAAASAAAVDRRVDAEVSAYCLRVSTHRTCNEEYAVDVVAQ